jgi:hypothetical protein
MTREELLNRLSNVENLVRQRPWWQQNLLAELSATMSKEPRPVRISGSDQAALGETSSISPPQSMNPSQSPDHLQ